MPEAHLLKSHGRAKQNPSRVRLCLLGRNCPRISHFDPFRPVVDDFRLSLTVKIWAQVHEQLCSVRQGVLLFFLQEVSLKKYGNLPLLTTMFERPRLREGRKEGGRGARKIKVQPCLDYRILLSPSPGYGSREHERMKNAPESKTLDI